jgi:hypothetical protein
MKRLPKEIFALNYYNWALNDFKQEIHSNFRLLKKIKDLNSLVVIKMMEEMPTEQRYIFANSLIKRFHPIAVEISEDRFLDEEKQYISKYFSEAGKSVWEMPKLHLTSKQINNFKKIIIEKVANSCVIEEEGKFHNELRFKKKIGNWYINTSVIFSNRMHSFDYQQSISNEDYTKILHEMINIESWLGISSMTTWTVNNKNEIDESIYALIECIDRFHKVIPDLLKDI